MPLLLNQDELIKSASQDTRYRTVILVDQFRNSSVYGKFDHPYQTRESKLGIEGFFNDSFARLKHQPADVTMTAESLPLIAQLGMWKITVITRDVLGRILTEDGEKKPIDSYMGLER